MATKRKSIPARGKNKADELARLSGAVWTLSIELDRARDAEALKLAPVLEAVAHALSPAGTFPREMTATEELRAAEALGRVCSEARSYLRARLGPERGVTSGEVYEALYDKIDTLLRRRCTWRELECAAHSALRALGQRSRFDAVQFRSEVLAIKAKHLDHDAPFDRWSVARAALRAGGVAASEIRKLDKARHNRCKRAR